MYMRVTRGSCDPAIADDVVKATHAVSAQIRRQPGYQSLQGGVDRNSGAIIVVSTWDSEQEANFPREALGDAFQRLVALGVQLDPAAIYETTE
jgi:heme-degrading monooxygenase HmoA